MIYSSKAIFLMTRLQAGLRKHCDIHISLQDPLAAKKLIHQAETLAIPELMKLTEEMKREVKVHAARTSKPSRAHDETSRAVPQERRIKNEGNLEDVLCALLANYCGPISHFLVEKALLASNSQDLRYDFDRIINCLAAEIDNKDEKKDFLERCNQLIWQ